MLLKQNWAHQQFKFLNREEFNQKLFDVRNNKKYLKQIPNIVCRRIGYFYNTYQLIEGSSWAELRIYDIENYEIERYKYMNTQLTTDEQNDGITGAYCYEKVNELFKKQYGISIFNAFSGRKYRKIYFNVKKCVPKQPHYFVETNVIDKGFKADVSSAFPAQAIKNLPTFKDCIQVEGRVDPTEEYPFAFYLNSHHIKILNELDSHDFENKFYMEYYDKMYNDFVPDNKEITLLCKKSEYSFDKIFKKLYKERKINTENKKIMNAFIGVLHYNTNPQCSHIASCIIARCVKDMCDRAKVLEEQGNKVFLISTDSILWRGSESNVATDEKFLGSFTNEEKNIKFCVRGCNCYQFEHEGTVITKFSGKSEFVRTNMALGDIFNCSEEEIELKDIFKLDGYFLDKLEKEKYKNGELFAESKE